MENLPKDQFITSDGFQLTYYTTPVPKNFKGIVQIIHGMAEHAKRYFNFSNFLYDQGFLVVLHDQRGHGESGQEYPGFFTLDQGWFRIVDDAFELASFIKNQHQKFPLYVIGHSMGSIVSRSLLIRYPDFYAGAVILGTTMGKNQVTIRIGRLMAKNEIRKYGATSPSRKLTQLAFGGYNKNFKNPRTKFDWLSENEANVDKYLADPDCGFDCSGGFFKDFLEGLLYVTKASNYKNLSRPILILSGACDPVSRMGREVEDFYRLLKKSGCQNLNYQLYPAMRHEILNEKNHLSVYLDIASFLENSLALESN